MINGVKYIFRLGAHACRFGFGSCRCVPNGDRHMSGIYQAYVSGTCMHDVNNNSLIRMALSVVRLLLELLEAY